MDNVLNRIIGKHLYIVSYDEFDDHTDIDLETEEQRKEYMDKFEIGDLSSYLVRKFEKCECCGENRLIDSVGGMHCETAEEALIDFIEMYDEGLNKCEVVE